VRVPGMPPPTMPLEDLQLGLTRIIQIIQTAPSLPDNGPIPPDFMKWAADASAMIGATNYFALVPEAQVAINGLSFADRPVKREQLMIILHNARAQIELELRQTGGIKPTGPTGSASNNDTYPKGLNGPSGPSPLPKCTRRFRQHN
jgi:hypothetical protein